MKLAHKAGICALVLTAGFLFGAYFFDSIRLHYTLVSLLTIIFSAGSLTLLYHYLIKRIEVLNQGLGEIAHHKIFSKRLSVTKQKDEISSIIHHANTLLYDLQAAQDNVEQKVKERTAELQNKNIELQHELTNKLSATASIDKHRTTVAQISRYDDLTTLPNRIFFNEILNKSIQHAKRRKRKLAILLIDIDNFDKLNQSIGTTKSNAVVKELGKRFTNVLRTEDILAKLDNDEFIVLLNDIDKPKFASTVAQKLIEVCSHPMKFDNHEFSLTCSIGICIYPFDGNSLEDLLKNADSALYKVRHAGGADYQFYTHEMDVEAREYIQLESALRKAIHNNELAIYYQPKLRLKTGKITGIEALMRWEHPVLGIINPAKFIPLAEETGLIMQISDWALKQICSKAKYWQDEGYEHISIAINVSTKEFYHPDLVKIITNALQQSDLNPNYLELEISERAVMDHIDEATEILEKIKATGVRLSLDHFGTGYTSITHLKRLPINSLKIDASFIKGIPNQPDDNAIVNALISLGHHLGLEIVASGVETAEQVQYLAAQNCDIVQGYFLSHPLPAAKIVTQFKNLREEVLY